MIMVAWLLCFIARTAVCQEGPIVPVADVFKVMELASKGKMDTLWPNFRVSEIPVLVCDGVNTYMFHSTPKTQGFIRSDTDPGVWVYKGRHPRVRGNSIVRLGEEWTATSVLSASSRRTGVTYDLKDMAGIIVHEQFHIFQRIHHPGWRQNDGLLLRYPDETIEALFLRRMEKEAFKRAVVSQERNKIVGWVKAALRFREDRLDRVAAHFALYEKELQLTEGLSDYIERKARGSHPLNASDITNGIAPAGIRDLGYVEGRWIAMILDTLDPSWKERLEKNDNLYLEDMLKEIAYESPIPQRGFDRVEVEAMKADAEADFSDWQTRKRAEIKHFFDAPGYRIELRCSANPCVISVFEPLEMEILDDGGVYHRLVFMAGNASGNLRILNHPCVTWFNDAFRLTRLMVNGLKQAPEICDGERKVIIKTPSVSIALHYSRVRVDKNRYIFDL